MGCVHRDCGCAERVWLPLSGCMLEKHPYCANCGVVKNISSDRGKRLGYFTNMLAAMCYKGYLTSVQMRLIVKKLEALEIFEDTYGTTGEWQKKLFIDTVKSYSGISESQLRAYFDL